MFGVSFVTVTSHLEGSCTE